MTDKTVAIKVKPLVWRWSEQLQVWKAQCEMTGDVIAMYHQSGDRWVGISHQEPNTYHPSADACKAHLDQRRATRILAIIEAVPIADVWNQAIEAAADIVKNTPEWKFGNLWHGRDIEINIRALPMPDDLGGGND